MEELDGKTFLGYLKFVSVMFDVDYLEEHNRCMFEDMESMGDQLLVLCVGTLFDWSCAKRFTIGESISAFIESLSFCT